jgi:hypothetical protein
MRFIRQLALLSLAGALPMLAAPAFADTSKTVPSGRTQQIDFFASLHPDCTSTGTPTVRLIDGPSKGLVTTENGRDFTAFAKPNPRARCNTRRVEGVKLLYRSADNFIGTDRVRILILSGSGAGREAIYDIQVR